MAEIIVGKTKVTYQGEKKSLTTAMYGWSRWGGVNYGLVQKKLDPEWSCQACGILQIDTLPPYMFEFIPREYIRICSPCHFVRLKEAIITFDELLRIIRIRHDEMDDSLEIVCS